MKAWTCPWMLISAWNREKETRAVMWERRLRASLSELILVCANLSNQIPSPALSARPPPVSLSLCQHVSYSSRGNLAQVICQSEIEEEEENYKVKGVFASTFHPVTKQSGARRYGAGD